MQSNFPLYRLSFFCRFFKIPWTHSLEPAIGRFLPHGSCSRCGLSFFWMQLCTPVFLSGLPFPGRVRLQTAVPAVNSYRPQEIQWHGTANTWVSASVWEHRDLMCIIWKSCPVCIFAQKEIDESLKLSVCLDCKCNRNSTEIYMFLMWEMNSLMNHTAHNQGKAFTQLRNNLMVL